MLNLTPTIRPYQPTDKPAVLQLLRLNTPAYFSSEEEADFIFYLDHELQDYFVVTLPGKVIGCGGINYCGKTGKISWDMLHPDYQNQGIGRQLLQFRIDALKANPEIELITVRTSQLAYRFYQKAGFKLIRIEKNYWADGFDLYEMELQN